MKTMRNKAMKRNKILNEKIENKRERKFSVFERIVDFISDILLWFS